MTKRMHRMAQQSSIPPFATEVDDNERSRGKKLGQASRVREPGMKEIMAAPMDAPRSRSYGEDIAIGSGAAVASGNASRAKLLTAAGRASNAPRIDPKQRYQRNRNASSNMAAVMGTVMDGGPENNRRESRSKAALKEFLSSSGGILPVMPSDKVAPAPEPSASSVDDIQVRKMSASSGSFSNSETDEPEAASPPLVAGEADLPERTPDPADPRPDSPHGDAEGIRRKSTSSGVSSASRGYNELASEYAPRESGVGMFSTFSGFTALDLNSAQFRDPEQLKKVEQKFLDFKERMTSLNMKLQAVTKQKNEFEARAEKLEKDNHRQAIDLHRATLKTQELEGALAAEKNLLATERKDVSASNDRSTSELNQLKIQLASQERLVAEMRAENTRLQGEQRETSSSLQAINSNLTVARKELRDKDRKLQLLEQERDRRVLLHNEAEKARLDLAKELDNLASRSRGIISTNDELREELRYLESMVHEERSRRVAAETALGEERKRHALLDRLVV